MSFIFNHLLRIDYIGRDGKEFYLCRPFSISFSRVLEKSALRGASYEKVRAKRA